MPPFLEMSDTLFDLARRASHALAKAFSELAKRTPSAIDLQQQVSTDGRVSVNMKPARLLEFLETGRRTNVFEWAAEVARPGRSKQAILREHLKGWYPGRTRFEKRYAGGGSFHYGALNIGGLGVPRFGDYCAVTKRDAPATETRLVFLSHDSLKGFHDSSGRLLERLLVRGIAVPALVGELSALKLQKDLDGSPEDWPIAVCSDSDFVEAVFSDAPTLDRLEEVRIAKSEYSRLQRLALRATATGRVLPAGQNEDVVRFERTRQLLTARAIPLNKG